MTLTITWRGVMMGLLGTSFLGLCGLGAVRLIDQQAIAEQVSAPVLLTVDPEALLLGFIEERALTLEGSDLARAVRKLDLVVAEEAVLVHAEYGVPIVKADLLFAGGTDYTNPFLARVLQKWDLLPRRLMSRKGAPSVRANRSPSGKGGCYCPVSILRRSRSMRFLR